MTAASAADTQTGGVPRMLLRTAPVLVLLVAAAVLWRDFHGLQPGAVASALTSIPPARGAAAAALTGISFLLMGLIEWCGLRWAGVPTSFRAALPTALCANALSHVAGFGLIAGVAVRARRYAAFGRPLELAARVAAFYTVAFVLGVSAIAGYALLTGADQRWWGFGDGLLAAPMLYVVACILFRGEAKLLGRAVSLPPPGLAAAQAAFGIADCLATAAIFWLLLPAGAPDFGDVVGPYALATAAGVVSHAPGGAGVFEGVAASLLSGVPAAGLAAAFLAYRLIYYLAPVCLAAPLVLADGRPGGVATFRRLWRALAPAAAAASAFAVGAALIFTGIGRIAPDRLDVLRQTVPVAVLEASHLICLVAGLILMSSALGLLRRRASANLVACVASGVAASTALLRGLDVGPSLCATGLAVLLALSRQEFRRRGAWRDGQWARWWFASAVAVAVGAATLGLWIYADTPYEARLWAEVGYRADPARFLRTLAILGAGILAAGVWALVRPGSPRVTPPTDGELDAIRPLVEASADTTARLALLGDKAILSDPQNRAFVMYGSVGASLIAMGDPVGDPQVGLDLLWRLKETADVTDSRLVVYHASARWLTAYLDLGLSLIKLGEEARVDLRSFNLDGGRRRKLRQTYARAVREGLSFQVVTPPHSPERIEALRAISDSWLASLGRREKGFSLGWFDPGALADSPIALVSANGELQAFANIWTGRGEASLDMMRHTAGSSHGVMDFLLVELMFWARASGYEWFNLGVAPLSGLVEHPLAPTWHKLGNEIARRAGSFYGFSGLRGFKAKFDPIWRPRYLAAPPLSLAAALVDASRLIARAPPATTRVRATPAAASECAPAALAS